jgi:rubrerythrin
MSKLKKFLNESNRPKVLNELFVELGNIKDVKMGNDRDKQLIRLAMCAEFDAANLYETMAEMTLDADIKDVLLDIAKEEKVHAGELRYLLKMIDDEEDSSEEQGENEVGDLIG